MVVLYCTVVYHTVLYSPETGPGLEDLAPPVEDQVGGPQPESQHRHRQHKGEGGRDAAGLKNL